MAGWKLMAFDERGIRPGNLELNQKIQYVGKA